MRTKRSEAEIRKWAEYVNDGHTYKQAAEKFKESDDAIYAGLRRLGLITRRTGKHVGRSDPERDAEVYEYMKTHTVKQAAPHFGIGEAAVYMALQRHRARTGAPAFTHGKPAPEPIGVSRQIFFLARTLDQEIVKEVRNSGVISGVARLALVLTNEILGGKK